MTIDFSLAATDGVSVEHDMPVTIVAGKDWIPLPVELDIVPGSALDFSALGLQDAPAGKHGWLKANEDGTFFFERQPDKPVRFYGVNFCFSAHYITHEQSDRLADRLVRLGYNAVRVHHYEGELTEPQRERTRLNPQKLDQLDYLVAACIRRGIYVTTDLFVSRPVDVDAVPSRLGKQPPRGDEPLQGAGGIESRSVRELEDALPETCSNTSIRTRSGPTRTSRDWPGWR